MGILLIIYSVNILLIILKRSSFILISMKVWIPLVDTGRRTMIQRGKIKIKISKTFIY